MVITQVMKCFNPLLGGGPQSPCCFLSIFQKYRPHVAQCMRLKPLVHRGNKNIFLSAFRNERHMSGAGIAALHNHGSCIFKKWVLTKSIFLLFLNMISIISSSQCKVWLDLWSKLYFPQCSRREHALITHKPSQYAYCYSSLISVEKITEICRC